MIIIYCGVIFKNRPYLYNLRFLPNKYVSSKRKNNEQLLTWTINTMQKLEIANFESDNIIFEKIEI